MKKVPEPEMLTVAESANKMHASESFIRTAYNNGDLDIFRYGDTIRISPEDLDDFKNRHTNNLPKFMSIEKASAKFGLPESCIIAACDNGDIEFFRYGDTIGISRNALIDFINRFTGRRSTANRTEVKAS